jgi:hypothetical protein
MSQAYLASFRPRDAPVTLRSDSPQQCSPYRRSQWRSVPLETAIICGRGAVRGAWSSSAGRLSHTLFAHDKSVSLVRAGRQSWRTTWRRCGTRHTYLSFGVGGLGWAGFFGQKGFGPVVAVVREDRRRVRRYETVEVASAYSPPAVMGPDSSTSCASLRSAGP